MKFLECSQKDVVEMGYIYTEEDRKCKECGDITHYIEICAEVPFCSSECEESFYKRLIEWEKRMYELEEELDKKNES